MVWHCNEVILCFTPQFVSRSRSERGSYNGDFMSMAWRVWIRAPVIWSIVLNNFNLCAVNWLPCHCNGLSWHCEKKYNYPTSTLFCGPAYRGSSPDLFYSADDLGLCHSWLISRQPNLYYLYFGEPTYKWS